MDLSVTVVYKGLVPAGCLGDQVFMKMTKMDMPDKPLKGARIKRDTRSIIQPKHMKLTLIPTILQHLWAVIKHRRVQLLSPNLPLVTN